MPAAWIMWRGAPIGAISAFGANGGAEAMRQTIELSDEMDAEIDRWRGRQAPIPSRAAAIRALLEAGLQDATSKAKEQKP